MTDNDPGSALPSGPGQIVWLASYPKSGNTWVRSLLTAYRHGPRRPLVINEIEGKSAATRRILDELTGLDTAELDPAEVRELLPHAYRSWSRCPGGPHYLKTHEAYALNREGEPVFPADATRCVIHVVRDPRDLVLSARHHWGTDLARTIARLNDSEHWIEVRTDIYPNVAQHVSDWSSHSRSWLTCPLPRLTLRYEDLLADTAGQFNRVLDFLGEEPDRDRVQHAVAACNFEKLQAQERSDGFVERLKASTAPFFRRGRAGDWRKELDDSQRSSIEAAHLETMRLLGYEV